MPAFVKQKKYTAWTVSVKTVRMVKSRPRKNQSECSDLPCYIIRDIVGDCLQDLTTNTLTRNPDFFYFIDHRKRSLPAQDYKVPFNFSSCSTVSFITVNHWFGFQLKCYKVQGYQIPTRDLSRHCT